MNDVYNRSSETINTKLYTLHPAQIAQPSTAAVVVKVPIQAPHFQDQISSCVRRNSLIYISPISFWTTLGFLYFLILLSSLPEVVSGKRARPFASNMTAYWCGVDKCQKMWLNIILKWSRSTSEKSGRWLTTAPGHRFWRTWRQPWPRTMRQTVPCSGCVPSPKWSTLHPKPQILNHSSS